MKTKNNVQKAILRSGAVVVSFILISLTVSAQDFWKRLLTNSSFNEIAIAMVETSGKTETTALPANYSSNAFIFQNETEPALELESWMTNTNYFNESEFQIVNSVEEPLELGNWMLDENYFNSNKIEEETLELENWMTSDKFWNS
ncbi:MAG TPA: hypothetical protein VKA38_16365 [Draconibacterium sp.]|nr:hypothetical protein [Draconibacterium sp.]